MPRYRFTDFTVSPRRRLLFRQNRELPLIPRYFDLLVFLIERRHEAVHRRDIFDHVWPDVIVSDSALSQAIRTIRRTLGDDSREPRFVRTVSRHGYRFVCTDVIEEDDNGNWPAAEEDAVIPSVEPAPAVDPFAPLIERITRSSTGGAQEEDQREAAELLHTLGTTEALTRLGTRPGHVFARALLRDTRWDSAIGADVPIFRGPNPLAVAWALVGLRVRRASRMAAARCAGAALGGGLAGVAGGALGGLLLASMPDSQAPRSLAAVLALIGGICGAAGGAGVGAGLSVAEVSTRSRRGAALIAGAALGGSAIGLAAQLMARWSLSALVGVHVDVGGGLEGLVIGATAGLGYAAATRRMAGAATPRGGRRLRAAALTALLCGLGTLALTLAGRPLVGGTIHLIATASHSSEALLTPLGHLIGEPDFGPISQIILGIGEGLLFGFGLAMGLTRRPSGGRAHEDLNEP